MRFNESKCNILYTRELCVLQENLVQFMCPDNENKPLNGLRSDAITYVGQPNKDLYRESGCISFFVCGFVLPFLLFLCLVIKG